MPFFFFYSLVTVRKRRVEGDNQQILLSKLCEDFKGRQGTLITVGFGNLGLHLPGLEGKRLETPFLLKQSYINNLLVCITFFRLRHSNCTSLCTIVFDFFFKNSFVFKTLAVLSTKNVIANQWYNCLQSKNETFKIIGQIMTQLKCLLQNLGVLIYMEGCVYS